MLPGEEFEHLAPRLERVRLASGQQLYGWNEPIEHVYFPRSGLCALQIRRTEAESVNVALVGYEGMVGVPLFLSEFSLAHESVCQVPGVAERLRAEDFKLAVARSSSLHDLLHRYANVLLDQVALNLACSRLHRAPARLVRWLLHAHDYVGADQLRLTHEFLAELLGLRRATVTEVLRGLQQAGLIHYRQRQVLILDRGGLEAATCEDYYIVRDAYSSLTGGRR
jgi:CRP-like cAMP-binding protein